MVLDAFQLGEQNGRPIESKLVKTLAIICQEASSIGQQSLMNTAYLKYFQCVTGPPEPTELLFLAKSVEDSVIGARAIR